MVAESTRLQVAVTWWMPSHARIRDLVKDRARRVVPQNSTHFYFWDVALEDVKVGPTDRGGHHLDNDVGGLDDRGVRNLFPALLARTFVHKRFHVETFSRQLREDWSHALFARWGHWQDIEYNLT